MPDILFVRLLWSEAMKSYRIYRTTEEDGSRPYYFIDGKRVSEERHAAMCRKCIRFDCLYTERLRNGR